MTKHMEIRTAKGELIESMLPVVSQAEAVARIKKVAEENTKETYHLLNIETLYDTANPPTNTGFF